MEITSLQCDGSDLDFLVEQREYRDRDVSLIRRKEVCPPIPDVHVLQRHAQAGKELDSQPATDADAQPQRV